jgi:hypothetical protein
MFEALISNPSTEKKKKGPLGGLHKKKKVNNSVTFSHSQC